MISFSPLLAVTLIPFVVAALNDTNSTGIQIEAIEAHFKNSDIVPSLLASFDPDTILSLSFTGVGAVAPGTALTQDQVKSAPDLTITPANSSISFSGNYTLVMADAGPVGTDESQGQTRHWLVNGVSVSGSSVPLNISAANGTAVTEYAGPAPAQGSGAHRYVVLLYSQPSGFNPPANLSQAGVPVSVFNLNDYVKNSNLGPIVGGTYFTVEAGTPTFTPSATSAVITSTLPPVSSGTTSSPGSIQSGKSSGALDSKVSVEPFAFVLAALFGLTVF